jgi:acyl-CoA synthetase (AMP-forming)/AMP-acid ligase II
MTCDEIVSRVLDFIHTDDASNDAFNELALLLFDYQVQNNKPLAKFARTRGKTPRSVKHWSDIPAVPINAFKSLDLTCCRPEDAAAIFMTSGTTRKGQRGKSHHAALDVYDASMRRNFANRFMRNDGELTMGILFPAPEMMPNSSLAHYLDLAMRDFGSADSENLMRSDGIDMPRLVAALERAEATGTPYALMGASFSLVHAMDGLNIQNRRFQLPPGSRILDTGGFKGQSRELEPDAFYDALTQVFGVSRDDCIGMYGMTELSTQFYDNGNAHCPAPKSGPHWIRSRVVSPLTAMPVPKGESGVLLHTDLAHYNIVTSILTEDAAIETDDGFLLLGRVEGAEAVGCSLAVDAFLKAASAV